MGLLTAVWHYILSNQATFDDKLATQLELSGFSLAVAILLCVPLGIVAARSRIVSFLAVNAVGIIRVVPSVAILFLAYPFIGFGFWPALIALIVLACPPVLINTATGFQGVDPAVIEAARGMGMSTAQILRRIQLPLALPVTLAGIRTAAIEVIASATLATFIGGGGLGDFITQGFSTNNNTLLLAGAVPVALLALCAELLFGGLQRVASPKV